MRPHRRQPTRLSCPWDSLGKNTGVGFHFLLQYMKVKSESEVTQSCPTLSDPMDSSLPGSSVHGIFQARVLEWGAIAFSIFLGNDNCFFQLLGIKYFKFIFNNSSAKLYIYIYIWFQLNALNPLFPKILFLSGIFKCNSVRMLFQYLMLCAQEFWRNLNGIF